MFSFLSTWKQAEEKDKSTMQPLMGSEEAEESGKADGASNGATNGSNPNVKLPSGVKMDKILSVIDDTTPERLALVLKELVKERPVAVLPIVLEQLFTVESVPSRQEKGLNSDVNGKESAKKRKRADSTANGSGAAPSKRTVRRYHVCQNCNQEFDVTKNTFKSCQYHEGERVVDDSRDIWADHDDEAHGFPETLKDEPDYEDGFAWSCCGASVGDEKYAGCVIDRHAPRPI